LIKTKLLGEFFGTQKAEVLNYLNENNSQRKLVTMRICNKITAVQFANALMMVTGVTEASAKCRLHRFFWPFHYNG